MNNHKILIADSGATKTDWCLVQQGKVLHRFNTKGISPIFQTQEEISEEIKKCVIPQLQERVPNTIIFYGSGCIPEKVECVKSAIRFSFPTSKINVYSDLIAAAHALCGNEAGIACILGTGSNSCEWNGQEIVKHVSPLGFILGDEGSGAYMGKLLMSDVLKNRIPAELKDKFMKEYYLTPAIIIENVYRKPFPSRFLASISPFLLQNIENDSVMNIVKRSFADFIQRNVIQYDYKKHKVNFVGSIAHYYATILKIVALENGVTVGRIEQSPMEGLIEYYKSKAL